MDSVLLLDTETTSVEPDAACIEVAAVLFSLVHASPVRSFASLIRADDNAAESINRIPAAMLKDAPAPETVWPVVARMASKASAILAHQADFDRRFVPSDVTGETPWVCSMNDVQWPRAQKPGESLVKLALAHDLGVASAHRALADCDLLARLLTRIHEMGVDLQAFIARGLRPKGLFVVADRRFDEARNEQCKLAGFSWDRDVKRAWSRKMALDDAPLLPFAVELIKRDFTHDDDPPDGPWGK